MSMMYPYKTLLYSECLWGWGIIDIDIIENIKRRNSHVELIVNVCCICSFFHSLIYSFIHLKYMLFL